MTLLFLEGGNYMGLFILILVVMLLPAIIMTLIGFGLKKSKPKTAKILFIISVTYIIICLGICGSMMT